MVREEIITGLNNALANGESLERAKNSLAMAGYNSQEIEEAARTMNLGTISNLSQKLPEQKSIQSEPLSTSSEYKPFPKTELPVENNNPKKKVPKIIIVLGIILVILVLGLVFFMALGDKILQALFGS